MAGPIQLTAVDFEQIKENLISYLKSTQQFTDFDFEGSNLQVILNLIAYQAQLNAYSTNMIANESFLASATLRNNVVANARMVGFTPASAQASHTQIDFTYQLDLADYPAGFPRYLEITPGIAFSSGTGMNNFIFNIVDSQTAAVANDGTVEFKEIDIYEGIFLEEKFTVDKSDYHQRFVLKNPNIDTKTARIEVQLNPNEVERTFFTQASNLVEINEESKVYWLEEVDDGYYELSFGDGHFGAALEDGATINVTYLVTNGPLANGIQGAANYVYIGATRDSFGARINIRPTVDAVGVSSGGDLAENVTSIKNRAPKSYASQNRCVIAEDYETLVKDIYPGVDDIYVYGGESLTPPEFGRVYIAVKPKGSDSLSSLTKTYIKKSLADYRVASIDIQLVDPVVLYVELDSVAYYDDKKTNKDASGIVAAVNSTMVQYGEADTVSKFGGAVRYSRILSAIDDSDVSITRNNTTLRMRRDMLALEGTLASYEVCFTNEIEQDPKGGNVWSTGFTQTLEGGDESPTYYFEDDGAGNLYSFYIDEMNNKVIVNKKYGTVDYKKGEVYIGYDLPVTIVNTTVANSIVEIRAIPVGQDVIAEQSVYLSLDIAKSDINSIVDTKITGS
jgi:hypothetical protein